MRSYIETILNAFSSMDIEALRLHLKDYHYQDAPKEVFLRELAKVFINFQHAGDTELIMYYPPSEKKNQYYSCRKGNDSKYLNKL